MGKWRGKARTATTGSYARAVGVVFLKADGTLGIGDGEHALLLLLEEHRLQHGPLLQQLVQL